MSSMQPLILNGKTYESFIPDPYPESLCGDCPHQSFLTGLFSQSPHCSRFDSALRIKAASYVDSGVYIKCQPCIDSMRSP